MKIVEQYSHSVGSSNLRNDERHSEPDVLAAVALTSGFASLLFRVKYANDASSYSQLRTEWCEMVTIKADFGHWPTLIKPRRVAIVSLDYWLHDKCSACDGLGYQKHENAPCLTDVACHICDGTGTAPFKCDPTFEKYAIPLLSELQQFAVKGGIAAMKKHSCEIDSIFTAYAPDELKK